MSKISEYREQLRRKAKDAERQSVADFASQLGRSPETLLNQLKDAGIQKASAADSMTSEDKLALLTHLQTENGAKTRRKKITITVHSYENRLLKSVARKENGAEFEALKDFAGMVISGESIDPIFQSMINLIVAKAVLVGALPLAKLGRPKRDELDSIGFHAAQSYWEMIDSGVGYQDAVEKLSGEFHKSERHIMRLISKHKTAIGETLEERSRKREWNEIMRTMYTEHPGALDRFKAMYEPEIPLPDLELADYLEHLQEMTQVLADGIKPLTKKT